MNATAIQYTLRPSRSRRLTITVYPDGRVNVAVPKHAKLADVERFIASKSEWIKAKLAHFATRSEKQDKIRQNFLKGEESKKDILFQKTTTKERTKQYALYKEQARTLVTKRAAEFTALYANLGHTFIYKKISIKNQKSRWGSCSRTGNLNFNWKIAFLPSRAADYIVVHELCHLMEMNHGKRFWNLVSRAVPEYKKIRKELRGVGVILG